MKLPKRAVAQNTASKVAQLYYDHIHGQNVKAAEDDEFGEPEPDSIIKLDKA